MRSKLILVILIALAMSFAATGCKDKKSFSNAQQWLEQFLGYVDQNRANNVGQGPPGVVDPTGDEQPDVDDGVGPGDPPITGSACDQNPCSALNRNVCTIADDGSAFCECNTGFELYDDGICRLINPCENACWNRECENVNGEAICGPCLPGFVETNGICGGGEICEPDSCPQNARCNDAGGWVWCQCFEGYAGNDCHLCEQGNLWGCGNCRDADGDGYFAGCSASSGLPMDCDDTDPNNWDSCNQCNDLDNDGWFDGCDAYVTIAGPDCNDNDTNNWTNCATCRDEDLDSRFIQCNRYLTIAGPDCDDQNNNVWVNCINCRDNDGDGFFVNCDDYSSCGGQPDCNDNNVNVATTCGTCADADNDGWWVGCDQYVTINGPDCNDNDQENWRSCGGCVDNDGDGRKQKCDAYITSIGPDCNDRDTDNWDKCATCKDNDGDDSYANCNRYVNRLGPDCDDNDPTRDVTNCCSGCGVIDIVDFDTLHYDVCVTPEDTSLYNMGILVPLYHTEWEVRNSTAYPVTFNFYAEDADCSNGGAFGFFVQQSVLNTDPGFGCAWGVDLTNVLFGGWVNNTLNDNYNGTCTTYQNVALAPGDSYWFGMAPLQHPSGPVEFPWRFTVDVDAPCLPTTDPPDILVPGVGGVNQVFGHVGPSDPGGADPTWTRLGSNCSGGSPGKPYDVVTLNNPFNQDANVRIILQSPTCAWDNNDTYLHAFLDFDPLDTGDCCIIGNDDGASGPGLDPGCSQLDLTIPAKTSYDLVLSSFGTNGDYDSTLSVENLGFVP